MAWSTYVWNGASWAGPSSLANPWGVEPTISTTDRVSKLLNGTEGRVLNTTKTWYGIRISWNFKNYSFYSTLLSYMTNGYILKWMDNSSTTITYIFKINQLSLGYAVIDGVIGYNVTIDGTQCIDPS